MIMPVILEAPIRCSNLDGRPKIRGLGRQCLESVEGFEGMWKFPKSGTPNLDPQNSEALL